MRVCWLDDRWCTTSEFWVLRGGHRVLLADSMLFCYVGSGQDETDMTFRTRVGESGWRIEYCILLLDEVGI